MEAHAWITLAVVVVLVVVMVRELIQPAVAMLGATILLLLFGVTTPDEAFGGFSNEAPFVIAAMLIVAKAVEAAGIIEPVVGFLFRGATRPQALLARLLFPVCGLSAFVNNTTLVAMTVPAVIDVSNRRRLSPSRFLLPVSFAAVLGGVITTVGTSTNLTVSGLLSAAGMPPLSLFELTPVGLPIAMAGVGLIVLTASRLLPDRVSTRDDLVGSGRDFTVAMEVIRGGAIDGKSIEDAGLRHLHGVFLVEIQRAGRVIAPAGPGEILEGGDLVTFVGRVDDVVDLQRVRGLESSENSQIAALAGGAHAFFEAVVGAGELAGSTLRRVGFRARYGGAVLAIHRAGQRLDAKLGEVRLRLGDTLLVLADPAFGSRWRHDDAFLLVAPLAGIPPTQPRKVLTVTLIVIGFIGVTSLGILPILQAALVAALLVLATRTLTVRQARDAIGLNLIVLIAAAFGVGAAVESSGLASSAAGFLTGVVAPFGPIGALAAVIVATVVATELMSNNAAAVLLFPVAIAAADITGADPRPFVIAVTLSASLSFLSPIGYQTNMMVYALGGYRFTDFARIGAPLTLACVVLQLLIIPLVFPL